jgi:hypothetical protein
VGSRLSGPGQKLNGSAKNCHLFSLFQYEIVSDTKVQSLRTLDSDVIIPPARPTDELGSADDVGRCPQGLGAIIERRIKWVKQPA